MDILEALAALDADNDEQWTTDGLPKVGVIAELVGNDKLKRTDILEASPDFNRDAVKAPVLKNMAGEVIGPNDEVAGPAPNYGNDAEEVKDAETISPEGEKATEEEVAEPKSLVDQLQDAFNDANTELNALARQLSVLTEQRKNLEIQVGYLGGQLDRAKKATGAEQSAIQQYLATQHRVKEEKAKARQALLDSGLAEVLKAVGPTALDAAMRQRKPLPSNVRREYPRAINKD